MSKTPSSQPPQSVQVDPSRLASGRWCHQSNRQQGEGDIDASYSADLIGMHGRVRKPFRLHGWLCVVTSMGPNACTAYRLVATESFGGELTSYAERVRRDDGEAARKDPSGFYHGMQVVHGGQSFVLCGPPIEITAGEPAPEQTDLFGEEDTP